MARLRDASCRTSSSNFEELKRKHEAVVRKVGEQQTVVYDTLTAITTLNGQLPAARAARDTLRQSLSQADKLSTQGSSAWFNARRLMDDIQRMSADWDA